MIPITQQVIGDRFDIGIFSALPSVSDFMTPIYMQDIIPLNQDVNRPLIKTKFVDEKGKIYDPKHKTKTKS